MTPYPDNSTPEKLAASVSITELKQIAEAAGRQIMTVFAQDFAVETKADNTPVTQADEAASAEIVQALQARFPWPVLSEEDANIAWSERRHWTTYWLVDPLDGTREFIRGSHDFTVNIALVHQQQTILGLIHAPASGDNWWGGRGLGASAEPAGQPVRAIRATALPADTADWIELGSRTHRSRASALLSEAIGPHQVDGVGSSLKLCRIAEGSGHLYFRLGPTSEWDTAAGQAILEAAGGQVLNAYTLEPLRYNTRTELENPWFVAACAPDPRWAGPLGQVLDTVNGT
ncbi:3'(2'),5'-bisphosphate nucleotidase CysQ [Natronospirillum operosum]|uniref:3'(2'),5'-bisphosphate nucleotidase CysQ n=1 Tax=Natronospirillum operosum TaxID=2759953 RepID=A0A4Z0WBK3_9GAMM|nr:3'(2'),5'-bisphosphate nucleotidase CysQ [Natronospirillum operosum]TGG95522.1 3'(2'),5'-bisphosphate nucleotidase CysQ [Natronospirillum operosum]